VVTGMASWISYQDRWRQLIVSASTLACRQPTDIYDISTSSFSLAMTPDPVLLDMSRKIDVFDFRKAKIVAAIASHSPDASPKGSIDTQILPLITRLNEHADAFTTSSCSGRISVFLEGAKLLVESEPSAEDGRAPSAPSVGITGGKGEGGKWLFVSHDPVEFTSMCDADIANMVVGRNSSTTTNCNQFDLSPASRFVHFKFETMVSETLLFSKEEY
jgi:tRNA(Phe) wybutosine-synthesizing methylase Tyw3